MILTTLVALAGPAYESVDLKTALDEAEVIVEGDVASRTYTQLPDGFPVTFFTLTNFTTMKGTWKQSWVVGFPGGVVNGVDYELLKRPSVGNRVLFAVNKVDEDAYGLKYGDQSWYLSSSSAMASTPEPATVTSASCRGPISVARPISEQPVGEETLESPLANPLMVADSAVNPPERIFVAQPEAFGMAWSEFVGVVSECASGPSSSL